MTKKQLIEKWSNERADAAGEASKLNVKLVGLNAKTKRLANSPIEVRTQHKGSIRRTSRDLELLAARIATIDQFLNDI